ncbi:MULTISPECIES: hypothetical protein [Halolamina]|uniref:Uncharacterized protein n=1 Tax=Halolamina pelagica TaxID=699431 RepID=A0A1I5VRA4_9EURY|nr:MULTISPECIES: hypothetical protein [Halolamina]NHX37812.1 hypothetical protein [Halolamina sp. R1-12]SFQ10025.1 hypothetical protein SAMN05216277_11940 [Halolamina pelagica]
MALEFSPGGRGILLIGALALALLIWMQTSGSWVTLSLLLVAVGIVTLLLWGAGTRIVRRVAGVR